MEILVHLISDLNRYLNLGLYVTFDGRNIHLNTLSQGRILLDVDARQSLLFYQKLTDLKRLITSWNNHLYAGKPNTAVRIQQQIYSDYHFDISKHYQLQKYGTY